MLKGKVINSTYTLGTSVVTKATKYGTFTGTAVLQEEDKDVESVLLGGYFAELKCDIQAYHRKAENMRERAKGVEHAYHVVEQAMGAADKDPDFILYDDSLDRIQRQVDVAWRQAKKAQDEYEYLRDTYPDIVEFTLRSKRNLRKDKNEA